MANDQNNNRKDIGKLFFVYLGSAWVFIEALNFLIDKYFWKSEVLDILIILVIFGLPALVIYLWFNRSFSKKAIILQSVNLILAFSVVAFSLKNPKNLNPSQVRILKLNKQREKLAASVRSMAILPFSNYTGSENNTIISGLHDALISELGKIRGIRVISKTSTLQYANTNKSIQEIASELGVDALVEASVLRVEENIRVQLKLIHAAPEYLLWSDTYEVKFNDVYSLYSQIINNISERINLTLDPELQEKLDHPVTLNPESYKAYLEANYQSEKLSVSGFELALEQYQKSISLDSTFAPAYAGLAWVWIGMLQMRMVSVTEAIPKIYEFNQKALTIDEVYPESQYIKALMGFQVEWDWNKSENAFRMAIKANPNHVLAHAFYSHLLMIQKRFDEAFVMMEKAMVLDPQNALVHALYGVLLINTGNLDKGLHVLNRSLEINPAGLLPIGMIEAAHYLKGNLALSMEYLERKHDREIDEFDEISEEYKSKGYEAAMLKLAQKLIEDPNTRNLNAALYFNRAGHSEEALKWLEIIHKMHDPNMSYSFLPAELNNLRTDHRYEALAKEMNLPF